MSKEFRVDIFRSFDWNSNYDFACELEESIKSTSFSNRLFAPQLLWVFFPVGDERSDKTFSWLPSECEPNIVVGRIQFEILSDFDFCLIFVFTFFYVWIVWLEMFSILKPNCFWKSEIRLHQNRSTLRNSEILQRGINPKKHFQQRQLRSFISGQSAKNCLYACHSFVHFISVFWIYSDFAFFSMWNSL